MVLTVVLKPILNQFMQKCKERNLEIDEDFAYNYLHLLARDVQDGIAVRELTPCDISSFVDGALRRWENPADPTVCNFKLVYYFNNCKELDFDYMHEKYDTNFHKKLQYLLDDILQYPENSNKTQIEALFKKMIVFIIVNYSIGNPKDTALLKNSERALSSVVGPKDLSTYIRKKKYNRLNYLNRLSETVCGIILYNNFGPGGDKEGIRDLTGDLNMAKNNTKQALDESYKRIIELSKIGTDAMANMLKVNVAEKKVSCLWPMKKLREINKYVALFEVYRKYIEKILEKYDKCVTQIKFSLEKFDLVLKKIIDVLNYRSAIDREIIFPHFCYLSKVWSDLLFALSALVELNKIKDEMDTYASLAVHENFLATVNSALKKSKLTKTPIDYTFEERIKLIEKRDLKTNLLAVPKLIEKHCSLTIGLTNGILLPATINKKICDNMNIMFGFYNIDLTKYAQRYFEDFILKLNNAIFTSIDLILLYNLMDEILTRDHEDDVIDDPKSKNVDTQTEMVVVNDLTPSNNINVTFNMWDFHRETIRLANIRKCQTHSTQTTISYGQRDCSNQTANPRDNP